MKKKDTLQNKENTKLLTVFEAAEFLKISTSSLYKLIGRGAIPNYKPNGGKVYFIQSELIEWIFASRRSTTDELGQRSLNYIYLGK